MVDENFLLYREVMDNEGAEEPGKVQSTSGVQSQVAELNCAYTSAGYPQHEARALIGSLTDNRCKVILPFPLLGSDLPS